MARRPTTWSSASATRRSRSSRSTGAACSASSGSAASNDARLVARVPARATGVARVRARGAPTRALTGGATAAPRAPAPRRRATRPPAFWATATCNRGWPSSSRSTRARPASARSRSTRRAAVRDRAYREFPQHFPRPGWVEHDADEIWRRDARHARRGRAARPRRRDRRRDRHHEPARDRRRVGPRAPARRRHRAIVWQDRRTAARCDELRDAGHEPLVRARTGLVLDPYFSATKLEWLLTRGRRRRPTPTSRSAPSTRGCCGASPAAPTAACTRPTRRTRAARCSTTSTRSTWSDELLDAVRRARARACPRSGRAAAASASTDPSAAAGLAVPVSGIAGDQQAALFGQACFEPGMAKNTYGTGSFVLVNLGPTHPTPVDGLLTTRRVAARRRGARTRWRARSS